MTNPSICSQKCNSTNLNLNFGKKKKKKKDETHLSLYNAIDQRVHVSGIKSMLESRHFIHAATQGPHVRLMGKTKQKHKCRQVSYNKNYIFTKKNNYPITLWL